LRWPDGLKFGAEQKMIIILVTIIIMRIIIRLTLMTRMHRTGPTVGRRLTISDGRGLGAYEGAD
jgi:hypothetical protein